MLKITSNSSYIDDQTGTLYMVGNITNIGTETATHTNVIATFYDSKGNVTWVTTAYSDPHDILPNQNASFTLFLPDDTIVPLVSSYALTAQSDQYAIIPEYPCLLILPLLIIATTAAVIPRQKTHRTKRTL